MFLEDDIYIQKENTEGKGQTLIRLAKPKILACPGALHRNLCGSLSEMPTFGVVHILRLHSIFGTELDLR